MKAQATAHSLYTLYETLPMEVRRAFLEELFSTKTHELADLIADIPLEISSTQQNTQPGDLPKITKGDKTIDPTVLFGIWKETPKDISDIRMQAWQRPGLK